MQNGGWEPTINFNEYTAEAPLLDKTQSRNQVVVEHMQKGAVSPDMNWKAQTFVLSCAHLSMHLPQGQNGFIKFRITTSNDVTVKLTEIES